MCGIAGEIRFDQRSVPSSRIEKMGRLLNNRGPDAQGMFSRNNMAFTHRRLKIIDLSDRGEQPMHDPHLGLTLVFNGCIYNYRDLRRQLQDKGYQFFSSSDSEVILKAYHAWGDQCVEHFNGMFAFVIYERDSGRVFMARDRLGIKPLYFIKTPAFLRFASTLPALLKTLTQTPEIDPVALHHYMTFHSVVPAPRTMFVGICKLPPAMTRTFQRSGTFTERCYWLPDFGLDNKAAELKDENTAVDALLEKFGTAVKRRTESDVPIGVLLSGGVDSSLVTGLLANQGVADLQTFSVGFEDAPEEAGDEFRYSDIIADTFATRHHKIVVKAEELMTHLPDCIHAMSEPMVSHDAIGFYLLSKKVSEHVKVVQSGQGADELFGGYHWYQPLLNSNTPVDDYANGFFDRSHGEYKQAVDVRFHGEDHSMSFVKNHFASSEAEHPVDKALRLDTTVMLVDDPVKRVDNMTMSWGLEARVPFLDHEMVDFSAQLSPEMKLKNGGKYILKQAARKVVPASVIDRPKGYFPVPALKYLRGKTLDYVKQALFSEQARERRIFNPAYINELLQNPSAHLTPLNGSKLWQLGTLELWLQSHHL